MELLDALHAKYAAEYEVHKAQVKAYAKNLTGVGEHIDYITPIEQELKKMSELMDLIHALEAIT